MQYGKGQHQGKKEEKTRKTVHFQMHKDFVHCLLSFCTYEFMVLNFISVIFLSVGEPDCVPLYCSMAAINMLVRSSVPLAFHG